MGLWQAFHHKHISSPKVQPNSANDYDSLLTDQHSSTYKQLIFLKCKTPGSRLILFNCYKYRRTHSRDIKGRTYWTCIDKKCNARIIINETTREIMPKNQIHIHREPPAIETYSSDEVLTYRVLKTKF